MSEVSRDVALYEFERMCDYFRIITDETKLSEEQLKDYLSQKTDIVDAIEDGMLTISVEGKPTFTTEDDKEFSYRQPLGKDYMDMDRYKSDQTMHKTAALTASLCNVQTKHISMLAGDDYMFLLKVTGFLIGSKKQRSSKQNKK